MCVVGPVTLSFVSLSLFCFLLFTLSLLLLLSPKVHRMREDLMEADGNQNFLKKNRVEKDRPFHLCRRWSHRKEVWNIPSLLDATAQAAAGAALHSQYAHCKWIPWRRGCPARPSPAGVGC